MVLAFIGLQLSNQLLYIMLTLFAMQMREKDLRPADAAQYAQQIMAGRIRISELGAVSSTAHQEHLVCPSSPCICVIRCSGLLCILTSGTSAWSPLQGSVPL